MKRITVACCGLVSLALLLAPAVEGKTLKTRSQDRNIPNNASWCPLTPLVDGNDAFHFQADGPDAILTFAASARPGQRIADVFVVEAGVYEQGKSLEDPCISNREVFNLPSRAGAAVFVERFATDANGWSLAGAGFAANLVGPRGGGSLALGPGGSASTLFTGLQKGRTYVVSCSWFGSPGDALSLSVDTLDPAALYLGGGRFKVEVSWQTPQGAAGTGHAVPLTDDTGYFWFFNPANVEVTLKVLNGCPLNQRYWIFASGLTNVGVQIRVTDTARGVTKTYANPLGTSFQPVQDTGALATCP
jgi:hypothetical protein